MRDFVLSGRKAKERKKRETSRCKFSNTEKKKKNSWELKGPNLVTLFTGPKKKKKRRRRRTTTTTKEEKEEGRSHRRRIAESRIHGMFVAPSTSRPSLFVPTPCICTRTSVLIRRELSLSVSERAEHSESISSMKMIHGEFSRASSNRALTNLGVRKKGGQGEGKAHKLGKGVT